MALLTPVAKAFSTDIGCEVASIGVQVHGGMGFIEETGAAQIYRDARILPIYEGTNGIQAIDLVTRKLPLEGGKVVEGYIGELQQTAERGARLQPARVRPHGRAARRGGGGAGRGHALDGRRAAARTPTRALAGAAPYLRLFGLAAGGIYLAKGALAAARDGAANGQAQPIALARFFAENLATAAPGLKETVIAGADSALVPAEALCGVMPTLPLTGRVARRALARRAGWVKPHGRQPATANPSRKPSG